MRVKDFARLIGVVMVAAFSLAFGGNDSFTDSRDGQSYHTVKIGNLTWMAENLNFQTGNSWCYDNDDGNCQKFGRLYDWNTAMTACPAGWRLPTRADWNRLVKVAGDNNTAGTKLKSRSPDWDGTDDFGFSALPGGIRDTDGGFLFVGSGGGWWSAMEYDASNAWIHGMDSDFSGVYWGHRSKNDGFSLCCVQDSRDAR
jgi:uncharacterized protein (TIGR02145 family)